MNGLICHQLDSAGSAWFPLDDPTFPAAYALQDGAYVMNVIRYRTSATQDQRSGATVYGTFVDAQSVNLWKFETAVECLTVPEQRCAQ
jgi:hypothetical protein